MKKMVAVFLVFLTVMIESTALAKIQIRGILPNLSLIVVISYGLIEGNRWGHNIGLLIGLIQDVLFCSYIGFFSLLYFYLGHLSGYGHRILRRGNLLIPLLLVVAGDLLYGFLCYIFKYFFAGQIHAMYYISHIIIPEAAYTSLFVLPIYSVLAWLSRKISRYHVKDAITRSFLNRERI